MKRLIAISFALSLLGAYPNVAVAGNKIEVETRNIYLGASLTGILIAPPAGIPVAVDVAIDEVIRTDFPTRAAALADEIGRERPDLIGIQEATLYRCSLPSDGIFVPPNATGPCPFLPGSGDFLADLLAAINSHPSLVKRGLSYVVVASVQNADIETPCFGPLVCNAFPVDTRLTDRDVILARSDIAGTVSPIPYILGCGVPPVGSGVIGVPNTGCNYTAAAPALGGAILRGMVGVTVTVDEQAVQFVNTHLEVQGGLVGSSSPTGQAFFQAFQATEHIALLFGFAIPGVPIIPVGDYNSGPADPLIVMVPSPPLPVAFVVPPYHQMVAAGFVDVEPRRAAALTCCQNSDLSNPTSILNERIDLIFATGVEEAQAKVIGDKPIGGLPNWASDHAGVVAKLGFENDVD